MNKCDFCGYYGMDSNGKFKCVKSGWINQHEYCEKAIDKMSDTMKDLGNNLNLQYPKKEEKKPEDDLSDCLKIIFGR